MISSGTQVNFWRRALRNLSALALVRGVGLITPILALPYIIRVVGLENYGYIAFSMMIATFAGSIIQYGFSISGVQAIAACDPASRSLSSRFWNIFYASLFIAFVVCALHLALILSLPSLRSMVPLHIGAILMATGTALFPHWLFLGLEKSFYVAFSTMLVRIGYLVLVVVCIRDADDYILVNFLGAAAAWLNVLIALGLIISKFKLRPTPIHLKALLQILRDTFSAFLLQWSPNLYNSASAILLGLYVSPTNFGAFNAASIVTTTVSALGQLMSNAFLPILSKGFDKHLVSAFVLITTGVAIFILVFCLAPYAAILLTETGQDIIQNNIRYLSFSIPLYFAYLAFGHNYVALTEKRILAGRLTVLISIGCLGLAFILIPIFGVVGFACVMVIARGSMALMAFFLFKQHQRATHLKSEIGLR